MADRSRWFESLSVPHLWRRVIGNDRLGVLRANGPTRVDLTDETPIAELPIRQDRQFPTDMPRPGAEYGATGTPIFGGFISGEDYNPKADGAKFLLIADEMRRGDASVAAVLRVLKQPLLSASIDVDPPDGSEDPQDQAVADFCASALFDDDAMAQPWSFAHRHILLKLDFGVSLLEKVFTVGELGEIRYHRLAPRLPRTIFRWIIDPETGTLEAVVQFAPKGGAFQYLTMPAKYVAVFCHEREGDNYFGRSILRSAYQHWWRKQQLYNIGSVKLDRYGVGIPVAEIDENHRPTDAELGEIKKILRGLRSHERGYIIQPYGVKFSIMTPQGAKAGDDSLMELVYHHDFMIANNVLAGFLPAATQKKGALQHTQTLAEIFQDSLQSIGDDTAGEILTQLIRPLCDLNFDMTGRKYPVVRVSGLDSVDFNDLSQALQRLGPNQNNPRGFVTPDEPMEDWLRTLAGAPPKTATNTAAPAGDGGVESPNPSPTPAAPGTPGAAISSKPARSAPAVSPPEASRLAGGTPSTETGKGGQIVPEKSATPNPRGDSGGSVVATPLERPSGQPPMTEPTSVPRPATPMATGQPSVGPTTIELDPTVDQINAPDLRPRSGLGNTRAPQGGTGNETAYGFGGPRKTPKKPKVQAPWPEGPLGPVKPPPPPGGAMGVPPLGGDTAIGNNDGYPLGLRSDPVVIDGRSFSRMPTQREEQIFNFREIPDRLDYEKDALARRLHAIRQQQRDRLIADLVGRDGDPSTGAFTDLRPDKTDLPLENDVYLAIRASQSRIAKYGALQVRSELQKQGAPVTAHGGRVQLAAAQTKRVFFVRHGETDDDRPPERVSSQASVPLNANGRATGEALAHLFADVSPLRIVSSPLERAQQTAALLKGDRTDVVIHTDPAWAPWHLGELTGQTVDAAKPKLQQLQANPDEAPAGGESWHAFTDRLHEAEHRILTDAPASGATIVLTHSWILRDVLQRLHLDDAGMQPGSVIDLTVGPDGRVLRGRLLAQVTTDTPALHLADRKQRAGAGKQKSLSSLVSSAQNAAAQLNHQLKTSVLDAAIRIRRTGVQGPELRAALEDAIDDDALDRGIPRAAGQEINEAFGLGRDAEASALSDVIQSVVRSAILDANCCDHCADMDGTEWDADDDSLVDTPDPECDGRDSCRCVNLYLTQSATEAA